MPYKDTKRQISSTGNFKTHYKKHHPEIATSEAEDIKQKKQAIQSGHTPTLFDKPAAQRSRNEQYRVLLLEFVIKNNLSFSIVDQPETKALLSFLSPNVKQISRATLIGDLQV